MVSPARSPRLPRGWRRYPFVTVLVVGWLGGGLLSAAVAAVVDYPNDHLYALAHTTGATLALLALTVLGALTRPAARAVHRPAPSRPLPVAVPVAVPEPRLPQRPVPVGVATSGSDR